MNVLIVSDIHANWAALEAIREEYDQCLFLGDLVDYGVESAPCIEWVRKHATHCVRGNHDHGAAQQVLVTGLGGFRYLTGVTRPLTIERLGEVDRKFLMSFPTTKYIKIGTKKALMVHASPRDPMDEYAPPEEEFWVERLKGIEVDYVFCGHTHMQYTLQVGKTLVVNPGSVGLPRDGDPRAAYALYRDGQIELKRVEYDVEQTIRSFVGVNLPGNARELLEEVYRHGKMLRKELVPGVEPVA